MVLSSNFTQDFHSTCCFSVLSDLKVTDSENAALLFNPTPQNEQHSHHHQIHMHEEFYFSHNTQLKKHTQKARSMWVCSACAYTLIEYIKQISKGNTTGDRYLTNCNWKHLANQTYTYEEELNLQEEKSKLDLWRVIYLNQGRQSRRWNN